MTISVASTLNIHKVPTMTAQLHFLYMMQEEAWVSIDMASAVILL